MRQAFDAVLDKILGWA